MPVGECAGSNDREEQEVVDSWNPTRLPTRNLSGSRHTSCHNAGYAEPQLLVPFVPLPQALRRAFCDPARMSVILVVVILTSVGMSLLPPDKFVARYNGGSNEGIASVVNYQACMHYCEKTHLDETGFGEEAIGGKGDCDTVKFCLFKSETPAICTEWRNATATKEDMEVYGHSVRCSFNYIVPEWQPYFVIGVIALAITFIIQGLAPEVALLGAVAIFRAAGVLGTKEALAGFASGSVVALALLLPIASAIEETGLLDRLVSIMLGQPESLTMALMRMMIPVSVLSAALSNTAVVAMLIPVVVSWSRRLGCHAGKLMMPLSFAAQLGGSMTLIGSSHVLVARESVSSVYKLGFFSTFPAALWLLLVTTAAILALAPTPLLRHSQHAAGDAEGGKATKDDQEQCDVTRQNTAPALCNLEFNTVFQVQPCGAMDGADADSIATTLAKLPGVKAVSDEAGTPLKGKLSGLQRLRCQANEQGVVALRMTRGLQPEAHAELTLLGAGRKERHLYVCAVADVSRLPFNDPRQLRQDFGCALIASRRPGSGVVPWAPGAEDADLRPSDVILLEADARYLNKHPERWFNAFSVICQVQNSSPPRNGHAIDALRAAIVCVGMVVLVTLVALDVASLASGCGIFLLILLAIHAITLQELYSSVKVSVIFTIVGAFGLSTAMQKTGVAGFVAEAMMSSFQPLGSYGLCAAVYLISVVLSMFISNSATVAIVGGLITSLVPQLAEDPRYNIEALTAAFVWILVCGAGSCFTTPLGYQTNMMVMPDGKYTFGDFVMFGGPVTLVHAAACIFVIPFMAEQFYCG